MIYRSSGYWLDFAVVVGDIFLDILLGRTMHDDNNKINWIYGNQL